MDNLFGENKTIENVFDQISVEIETLRLKQVSNIQGKQSIEKEYNAFVKEQSFLLFLMDMLKEMLRNVMKHEKRMMKLYFFLNGSYFKSKVTCYVKETLEKRLNWTKKLVSRYNFSINNLEDKLAEYPACVYVPLNEEVAKLRERSNALFEQISLEQKTVAEAITVGQNLISSFESDIEELCLRLTDAMNELEVESDDHSSMTDDTE